MKLNSAAYRSVMGLASRQLLLKIPLLEQGCYELYLLNSRKPKMIWRGIQTVMSRKAECAPWEVGVNRVC